MKNPILICTLGTRGDVAPFLSLAAALCRRGCPVTFLSNENWRDLAQSCGARFIAIAPEDLPQNGRDDFAFYRSHILPSFGRSFRAVCDLADAGIRPTVVYRIGMLGAQWAADARGLPRVKIALQPAAIRSVHRPPWPISKLVRGRIGARAKHLLLPPIYLAGGLARRRILNEYRKSIGLPPLALRDVGRWEDADLRVLMCPEWFAMPQKDWPRTCTFAGFPFFDSASMDAKVEEFLSLHGPPLVFTPGTGTSDTTAFFRMAQHVAENLRHPALFVSPHASASSSGTPILCTRWVNLATVLPRSRALFHHGGIGTVAQALRAGIPQIIKPDRFDQPDNAERVVELRLGVAVQTSALEELTALAKRVLNDPIIRQQVAIASESIRRTDATANVISLLEELHRPEWQAGGGVA